MKAITFQGVGDVRAKDVADPKIVDPSDVVLRITTSAVCGSDLHQYHGRGGALVQTGTTRRRRLPTQCATTGRAVFGGR